MRVAWLTAGLAALACTPEHTALPSPEPPAGTSRQAITILNYQVQPAHLSVTPGSTVVIVNEDTVAHWLMSAAAQGSRQYGEIGGVGFDVYVPAAISGQYGLQSFSIPESATPGAVVPYFCFLHAAAMLDEPDLTIAAP